MFSIFSVSLNTHWVVLRAERVTQSHRQSRAKGRDTLHILGFRSAHLFSLLIWLSRCWIHIQGDADTAAATEGCVEVGVDVKRMQKEAPKQTQSHTYTHTQIHTRMHFD